MNSVNKLDEWMESMEFGKAMSNFLLTMKLYQNCYETRCSFNALKGIQWNIIKYCNRKI